MPGRIIDLSQSGVAIPDRIGFDTSVLITRFVPPRRVTPEYTLRRSRVKAFLAAMRGQRSVGFLTPTALLDLLHIAIKAKYTRDLPTFSGDIGGKKHWELLFKARPDLLTNYVPSFERLLMLIGLADISVVQPASLGPIPSGRRFEAAIIEQLRVYQLDTMDAAILLEIRRAGLDAIVTEDPDLRRAATDFDVYTWF